MKSVLMRCPKCLKTSELDNLHLLDHSFKREWIGLTGLEQKELMAMSARDAVFATEAKLKEKNT